MVHNMAPFMRACINSLQWVDAVFLYDDHSVDGSAEIAKKESRVPIVCEVSKNSKPAFTVGELKVRNYVLDRAFDTLGVDVMLIADADEIFSSLLRDQIVRAFRDPKINSVAFPILHLYDEKRSKDP